MREGKRSGTSSFIFDRAAAQLGERLNVPKIDGSGTLETAVRKRRTEPNDAVDD